MQKLPASSCEQFPTSVKSWRTAAGRAQPYRLPRPVVSRRSEESSSLSCAWRLSSPSVDLSRRHAVSGSGDGPSCEHDYAGRSTWRVPTSSCSPRDHPSEGGQPVVLLLVIRRATPCQRGGTNRNAGHRPPPSCSRNHELHLRGKCSETAEKRGSVGVENSRVSLVL